MLAETRFDLSATHGDYEAAACTHDCFLPALPLADLAEHPLCASTAALPAEEAKTTEVPIWGTRRTSQRLPCTRVPSKTFVLLDGRLDRLLLVCRDEAHERLHGLDGAHASTERLQDAGSLLAHLLLDLLPM